MVPYVISRASSGVETEFLQSSIHLVMEEEGVLEDKLRGSTTASSSVHPFLGQVSAYVPLSGSVETRTCILISIKQLLEP